MLDPAFVREHFDDVQRRLAQRGADLRAELESLAALDVRRRGVIPELENERHQRKQYGDQIARGRREGTDVAALVSASGAASERIKELERRLEEIESERQQILLRLPNIPHESVPVGKSEADNQEVRNRRQGEPRSFDFTPKAHWDLGPALGIIDFERAAMLAGSRFSILRGDGAALARALINFMLDLHTREHGYLEVQPPALANAATLTRTGQLPKFEADLFKVAGDWDLYLIPTSEVPLVNLHSEEILDGRRLPIGYTAYTPCFRSEAGSYGKDVRGMIRQHQFDKVELVKFTTPEQSYDEHERLTSHAEEVLRRLGLPSRTMALSTADLGFAAAKTYDIEVWLPGLNSYKEISSCSNTEAFQARRANIKFRPDGTGKAQFVHTLNGSGLAVGRTLIAILENYQQRDGSVVIPDALRRYMGGKEVIEPVR